ncbi:MAG: Dihydrolipoyllysine-residue acetyltransferase component of pyruvate dehydrogenase complex, partial [Planctomycetota bacterium]
MPTTVTMPRLSDTMEAGTVIKWHVKEGDTVATGDVLADVETDKATMEMQAYDDGVVAKLLIGAGDRVAIGTPIAVIAVDGEDASSA